MNDDERWNQLQRRAKLGLITRDEALSCGITSGALRRRVARGHLQRVSARVFRFAGTTETWDQRALAALWLLGPQSALSHQSAASILGIQQGRPPLIDVTVPRESVSSQRLESLSERVRVHRSRTSFAVKQAGHFQVTTWARTLIDLARVLDRPDQLDDALDTAQRKMPGVDGEIERALHHQTQGRRGAARLIELIEDRNGSSTDSELEAAIFRGVRRRNLKRPTHQFEVFDAAGYVVRLDFAWLDELVTVHGDSYQFHHQRSRFEHDREVLARLAALGWMSVPVTRRMLDKGDAWIDLLRATLEARAPQRRLF